MNTNHESRQTSPLPGLTSPRRWSSQVVDLEVSSTPLLSLGSTSRQPLSPSHPVRMKLPSIGPAIPLDKPSSNPSPSPRAFPRLAVSSKSRAARPRPPPTAPRHSVKCPMIQKTVKKPMRLQHCPQVCRISFFYQHCTFWLVVVVVLEKNWIFMWIFEAIFPFWEGI